MYYLDAAMNHVRFLKLGFFGIITHSKLQGNYDFSYEATEPDPRVVDLNTELVQCYELMSIKLPPKDQQYCFLRSIPPAGKLTM